MAKLTYQERKKMPKKDFALPATRGQERKTEKGKGSMGKGGYPIPDEAHARAALARVARFGTPAEKKEVREKVHKKYPDINIGVKKKGEEKIKSKGVY